jgi:hypothetical protein
VAVELSRRSGNGRIVSWPQSSIIEPEMSVPIDVQRFDAEGFGKVTLEAVWTLRKGEGCTRPTLLGHRAGRRTHLGSPRGGPWASVDALAADIASALPITRTPDAEALQTKLRRVPWPCVQRAVGQPPSPAPA